MIEHRIAAWIELRRLFGTQWGHPDRVFTVEVVRQVDEITQVARTGYRLDHKIDYTIGVFGLGDDGRDILYERESGLD